MKILVIIDTQYYYMNIPLYMIRMTWRPRISVVFISTFLAFLLILSSMSMAPQWDGTTQTTINHSSTNGTIPGTPQNLGLSTFSPLGENYPSPEAKTVGTTTENLMISGISSGGGYFLVTGENTSSTPLLMLYNNGETFDFTGLMPTNYHWLTSSIYYGTDFYFGGMSNNGFPVFGMVDPATHALKDLSGKLPSFPTGGNVYSLMQYGNSILIGGYSQGASAGPFLLKYFPSNGTVVNMTGDIPAGIGQVLSMSTTSDTVLITGVYEDIILNMTTGTSTQVTLPHGTLADFQSAPYNRGYLIAGSSIYGGQLLYLAQDGTVSNYSSLVQNSTYEIITLTHMGTDFFLGGWGLNGSYAAVYDPSNNSVSPITLSNIEAVNGSEITASSYNGTAVLAGGAVVTQFSTSSGDFLLTYSGGVVTDLSNLMQKSIAYTTYTTPASPEFYVYADPNYALPGQTIEVIGINLVPDSSAILCLYGNHTEPVNNSGGFSTSITVPVNASAGDVLISLYDGGQVYHNYLGVFFNFTTLAYGATIAHSNTVGSSLLKYGVAVPYGNYTEFIRINQGNIPYTSFNYLVQWINVEYNTSYSGGWHPAPSPFSRAVKMSINPLTIWNGPWTQGISYISPSGQFLKNYNNKNAYLFINGSLMISWVPQSYINDTSFTWSFDTDYVQNAPIYSPAFRLESGQDILTNFTETFIPSVYGQAHYSFNLTDQMPRNNWFSDVASQGANFYITGSTFEYFNTTSGTPENFGNPSGYYNGIFSGDGNLYLYGNWYMPSGGGLILSEFDPSTFVSYDLSSLLPSQWSVQGTGDQIVSGGYSNGSILLLEASHGGNGSNLTLIQGGNERIISQNPMGYRGGSSQVSITSGIGSFLVLANVGGQTVGEIISSSGEISTLSSSLSSIDLGQGNGHSTFLDGNYYVQSGTSLWDINGTTGSSSKISLPFSIQAVTTWNGNIALVGQENGADSVYIVNYANDTVFTVAVLGSFSAINSAASSGSTFMAVGMTESGSAYPDAVYVTDETGTITGTVSPTNASVSIDGTPVLINGGEFHQIAFQGLNSVTASYTGYFNYSSTLSVSSGEDTPLNVVLSKEVLGNLTINVTPSNSSIMVNGILETPVSGVVQLHDVPYGPYYVIATNPYYEYQYEEVTLSSPDMTVSLTLHSGSGVQGTQYPWTPLGPIGYPNPAGTNSALPYGTLQFAQNGSGHIGPAMAMDYSNPSIIYVAQGTGPAYSGPYGDGGIFKTTNGGQSWQPVDYGLPYGIVSSLYMNQSNPNMLLAGIWDSGVYRTDDGGGYWYKVSDYYRAVQFTQVGNSIIAGTQSGIISSSNFGLTWTTLYSSSNGVESLSVSGNTIYAMLTNHELVKSMDTGKTWTQMYNFGTISYDTWSVSVSPVNPNLLYVCLGIYQGVVSNTWVSDNGGSNFTPFFPVQYSKQIVFDPYNQSRLWAYGPGYSAYSTDGGVIFTPDNQVTDNMGFLLDQKNQNIALIGSDQGVYETTDGGINWTSLNSNLNDSLSYGISVGSGGNLIITSMQDYSAFISYNGGNSWFGGNQPPIPVGEEGTDVYVNPYNSAYVYSVFRGNGGLFQSSDGAKSFTSIGGVSAPGNYQDPNDAFYANPYNHSRIYFATAAGIYVGTDYGSQWSLWSGSPENSTSIVATSANSFLVGTTDGVYNYQNGVWQKSSGISGFISSLSVDPGNPGYVVASTGYYSDSNGYISSDGGNTFTIMPLSFNAMFYPAYSEFPLILQFLNTTGGYSIVAATNYGIYLSTDLGKTWNSISYNLHSGQVTGIDFVNGTLYISTYGEGDLEMKNFSVQSLPGTINGDIRGASNLQVTLNDKQIETYDGQFEEFLPGGTYYVNATWTGGSKDFVINLSPMQTASVNYITAQYKVTLTETGLPPGTPWEVSLFGYGNYSSTSANLSFYEPNGTYSFTAYAGNHSFQPSMGVITINGNSLSVIVSFTLPQYTVLVNETGLPDGMGWFLDVNNGGYHEIFTNTTTLFLENGTYDLSASNLTEYYTLRGSISITVSGQNVYASFEFLHYAFLTGVVSPSGTTFSLNGRVIEVSSGSFNISLPQGAYHLTVSKKGYMPYYSNFTLIPGEVKNISINLHKVPLNTPNSDDLYIGLISVGTIGAIAFLLWRRRR